MMYDDDDWWWQMTTRWKEDKKEWDAQCDWERPKLFYIVDYSINDYYILIYILGESC